MCYDLLVSVLDYESSGLGSCPDKGEGGYCTVFMLSKTLYPDSSQPLVTKVYKWILPNIILGGSPTTD